ncbi:efflux transporter outer membrane subunit [Pseudomonas sp. Gutcm_11s]|uniref:efflux transporter outer membrane subunit n=1 Tax=Pseudomonas sp. Gutcm_11s TaxID=3026088 RepID=UPI002362BE1C|nr:efflux transporter outer membrane subunit [Pseudomonas sp. Gutcm_11s]MDD0844170.1 efflux transporter outer membrane subunit [Pseudomonas sp. Gutcm_11s]
MNRFPATPLLLALAITLGGCGSLIETPYQQPAVQVPADWQQQAERQAGSQADWWKAFGDAQLDSLVEQALAKNNDLGSALLNIRRARLQAGLAREAQWPQPSAGFDAGRSRDLGGGGSTSHSYALSGSVGWEADLWNRLGSATEAAELEALATEQDYAATRLSLIGTVATLYWQIAYLNERLAAANASIDYARQTLALVQVQYNAGQASSLELAEAQQSLESQLAAEVDLRQQRVEQRNALAVLFDGVAPVEMEEPQSLLHSTLPAVDAGLPAALLGQRPDLRAAELRLRSNLKSVDATRASYYPDLSLTGTLGYSSTALGELLKNPVGALGAGLTLPFLQYRQMQLDIDVSKTDYELAVTSFRQTLYEALADVENNLAGRRHYAEQEGMRSRALDAAQEAERIYRIRYQSGAETLQSWLTAQETRRSAEITLSENHLNQLLNYINLSQALGGSSPTAGTPQA